MDLPSIDQETFDNVQRIRGNVRCYPDGWAGATEELKARDPMRWVGLMNCRKAQVEEIIFAELIYC